MDKKLHVWDLKTIDDVQEYVEQNDYSWMGGTQQDEYFITVLKGDYAYDLYFDSTSLEFLRAERYGIQWEDVDTLDISATDQPDETYETIMDVFAEIGYSSTINFLNTKHKN